MSRITTYLIPSRVIHIAKVRNCLLYTSSTTLELYRQVYDRDVHRRYAEGHTRELTIELGDYLADSLSSTR